MTLLTCSHCDGAIKPRREAKDRHGRRRYCSRTCSAAGARASAKAARALLLRRCEVALKKATRKARDGSANDVYAGHVADRYTLSGYCVECQRQATRAQKAAARAKRGAR